MSKYKESSLYEGVNEEAREVGSAVPRDIPTIGYEGFKRNTYQKLSFYAGLWSWTLSPAAIPLSIYAVHFLYSFYYTKREAMMVVTYADDALEDIDKVVSNLQYLDVNATQLTDVLNRYIDGTEQVSITKLITPMDYVYELVTFVSPFWYIIAAFALLYFFSSEIYTYIQKKSWSQHILLTTDLVWKGTKKAKTALALALDSIETNKKAGVKYDNPYATIVIDFVPTDKKTKVILEAEEEAFIRENQNQKIDYHLLKKVKSEEIEKNKEEGA